MKTKTRLFSVLATVVLVHAPALAQDCPSQREGIGAYPYVEGSTPGVSFRVWAPNADSVHVTGSFNFWSPNSTRSATKETESGPRTSPSPNRDPSTSS